MNKNVAQNVLLFTPSPILKQALQLSALLGLVVALALLPLPLAALLVVAGALLILSLIDPIWALYAAVLAVPAQELVTLPGGLSLVQAALLLAAATWLLRILARPERWLLAGRVLIGLAALLFALALSTATTPYSQAEAAKETLRWSTVVLVYLLALNSIARSRLAHRKAAGLVACLLLAPAGNALFGLWQFVTGSGPQSFAIAGGFVRAYGTIGMPNSFAGYMNMAWPLAVALALAAAWGGMLWLLPRRFAAQRPPLHHVLPTLAAAGLAAVVLLGALVASLSRGSWLGAAAGAAGMLLASLALVGRTARHHIWQWVGLAAVAGVLLVFVGTMGLLPAALTQRASSIVGNLRLFDVRNVEVKPDTFAVVERMAQIQAAWAMYQEHPLTGVGPGNYTLAYEGKGDFYSRPYFYDPWYGSRGHAHNYYIHIAAEAGTLGLLAYLLLLGLLVRQSYIALIGAKSWFWRGIAAGGCGIITGIAVHNLFENLHVLNMGVQLGAVWGLLAAIERIEHEG